MEQLTWCFWHIPMAVREPDMAESKAIWPINNTTDASDRGNGMSVSLASKAVKVNEYL
jgi:hypothetical protein